MTDETPDTGTPAEPQADLFEQAITAESTHPEPRPEPQPDTTPTEPEHAEKDDVSRDAKGRFASKPEEPAATPAKKAPKPLQDRIDRAVAAQRDAERRADALQRELETLRRPPDRPVHPSPPPQPERFPRFDAWSASHPTSTHDDYLDARDEWRDSQRETRDKARAEDSSRDSSFDARVARFATHYGDVRTKDPDVESRIDQSLLTAKPWSTLTAADRAMIQRIPDVQTRNDFAFKCFLADQWIDSEHAVAILEHLSDPDTYRRLVTLPPNQVIREMARIEARESAASSTNGSATRVPASQARPPIKPVGSAPKQPDAEEGADDEAIETFIRRENVKARKEGRW